MKPYISLFFLSPSSPPRPPEPLRPMEERLAMREACPAMAVTYDAMQAAFRKAGAALSRVIPSDAGTRFPLDR